MQNPGLDKAQAGVKIAGRNVNNLRYSDDTTLMAESKEELKRLLMKVKEESEKVGLKLNIQKSKIIASGPITLWQIDGEIMGTVRDFIFLGSKITADGDCKPRNYKMLAPWKKSYDQPRMCIKKQRHYFTNKGLSSQSYGFSSSHVWVLELDWMDPTQKFNAEELILLNYSIGDSSWESLGLQGDPTSPSERKPSWIFIGKTDAETPILWPPDLKNRLIGKDPDAGKDWRQEEQGMTEDETVGWNHRCNGHDFEQALGVGAIHVVSKSRTQLSDWTELNWFLYIELSIEPHALPLGLGARSILLKYMICLREERHDRHCVPSTDLWLLPNCWTNWILI